MDDSAVINRILGRIDKLDDKMDKNITDLKNEITDCKLDFKLVRNDLTNHLNNKKAGRENDKRKIWLISACLGLTLTVYGIISGLF